MTSLTSPLDPPLSFGLSKIIFTIGDTKESDSHQVPFVIRHLTASSLTVKLASGLTIAVSISKRGMDIHPGQKQGRRLLPLLLSWS